MTVVATIITAHFTAHASDSFLTEKQPDGSHRPTETEKTKLLHVPAWRGAMAYWGLAYYGKWHTLNWLRARANNAGNYGSAEDFARAVATELDRERKMHFPSITMGIGIHFTAYEYIHGYYIPELFLISNWTDLSYSSCRPTFSMTRETYGTHKRIEDRLPEHGQPDRRLEIHSALHNDKVLFHFNNGDTLLFNPIAHSIFSTFSLLLQRGQLRDPADVKTHLSLVRRPVEVASKLLSDLAKPGSILIGGKPHDLAIAPNGTYKSTTGD